MEELNIRIVRDEGKTNPNRQVRGAIVLPVGDDVVLRRIPWEPRRALIFPEQCDDPVQYIRRRHSAMLDTMRQLLIFFPAVCVTELRLWDYMLVLKGH